MLENSMKEILLEQTKRALWEVHNVIDCIPDELWDREYCQMPMWKHVYHMLHSLDLWFINPRDPHYREPSFHEPGLNDLDVHSERTLTRCVTEEYCRAAEIKIMAYLTALNDDMLLQKPEHCEYARFTLILAQYRHLHTHLGMIMGFIIADTGKWPRVLGLEGEFPQGQFNKYA
jgi:hypothetical protein